MYPGSPEAADTLKRLKETDISRFFDKTIYERGVNYFEQGRIQRPVVYHSNIMADCRGTLPEDYHIRIELRDDNIIASCTCPYAFGYCKHIAAVLYGWIRKPSMFMDLGRSEYLLKQLDKDAVVEVVMDMIKYDPDVTYVINLRLTPHEELASFVDREMKNIFSEEFVDYLNVREIAKKLDIFREYSSDLLSRGDADISLTVIKPVLDSVVYNYTKLDDVDGLMRNFFTSTMDLYGDIMASSRMAGERRRMLTQALDWFIESEWGLERVMQNFLKSETARLKEKRFMINSIELKIADYKRSLIMTGPKYSEEYEYIDERVQRLSALRSDIRSSQ